MLNVHTTSLGEDPFTYPGKFDQKIIRVRSRRVVKQANLEGFFYRKSLKMLL